MNIPDPVKPYLYGALALSGIACAWWFVNTVQKAALYDDAQDEIAMANDTIDSLVNEHVKMQEKYNEEAKKRHENQLRAEKLERKFSSLAASGDAAAFNVQLCELLEGIQGARFGEEADPPGSACDDAARGKPRYTLTERSSASLLSDLSRIRNYVEQVEALR